MSMVGMRRALGGVASVALIAVGLVVVGPAAPAMAAAGTGGGFVWASDAAAALNAPYTPSTTWQYNSTSPFSAVNTVRRVATGQYFVWFPNLMNPGVPHATAYGGDSGRCTTFGTIGRTSNGTTTGTDVIVYCFDANGQPTDHRFTASYTYLTSSYQGRPMAYVVAEGVFGRIAWRPFNSRGQRNSMTRTGPGNYTVRLASVGGDGGHVQVTASTGLPIYCKVAGWFSTWGDTGLDEMVNVLCFDNDGSLRDSDFTLTYVDGLNILGLSSGFNPDGHESAYAWADLSWADSYQPHTSYQFRNGSNTAATATRATTGTYAMQFAYANLNTGNVQVTAYGWGSEYCGVAYWNSSAGIQVRCFSPGGAAVDVPYDVAFTGPFVIG